MPQQKSKKIFIYLFLFFIVGTFNNKNFYNSNFLKIDLISIKGLDEENNSQLVGNLNFLKNEYLFFLNKNEIKEIINANNLVENFSVFKIYPSSLYIKLDETKFLAKLKKNNDIYLLGSNGKFIKENFSKKNSLPFIFGDFRVTDFFELKKVMDETNFNYKKIKNLYFYKSGRWDIELDNDILIKLPKDRLKEFL
jgi:Cell division septal protein